MKPQTVLDRKKRLFKRYRKKICSIKNRIGRPPIPKEHIVTEHPTLGWIKQQIHEAPPWEEKPKFLTHYNDGKYGQHRVK